ncbi:hypothetical protein [Sinomonas terrae]|uniref:Uncharacterized protein n=1 Tax=Sinomonas terrae TaxID=2908838 RepID=A0ABS9U4F4_9MICC|nr:hypothetical protein [Sinomonas terrae]MCH6471282.1 hypothetical protein [Sinomonas terrae]
MTKLTAEELAAETVELLPDRDTLSTSSFNWAGINASNSSLALNLLAVHSTALSNATQTILVMQ